ncbi:FIST signal transduction protein [Algihabitans albus]|uniref:FIST signal transduction protein n=1 Tax=Algihabitans albus TaxID=2164067 RepID=UPI000E5C9B79|nr:FIST N-terminal domain-containing protein [Algihabitans albus]
MNDGLSVAATGFRDAYGLGDTPEQAIEAAMARLGQPAEAGGLGIVYVNEAMWPLQGRLVPLLRQRTGVSRWIGTVGGGIIAGPREFYDRPAVALMVADLTDDLVQVIEPDRPPPRSPGLGIVHGDPRSLEVTEGLMALAGAESYLVGGLAGGSDRFVTFGERLHDAPQGHGLSGAILDRALPVAVGLSQGCSPVGPVRRITSAERNVVATLDERPALEVLKEDVGELLARDLRRAAGYIHVAFPLQNSDRSDYLVRNLVGIDAERGLIAVGEPVEPGRAMVFVRRDPASARKDLERMLSETLARADSVPRAALYFSCVARGRSLFGQEGLEATLVQEALARAGGGAEVPMIGFFGNGEICHDRLYGYTGVLTLFL